MDKASAKELFILGRVSLRPTHGHEIMRTLRESHADLWIELSEKHVYYVLRKLDSEGFVTATEQRSGNLPARRVYAITDAGRAVLAEMMSAQSLVRAMPYSQFDVVLGMLCYTDALDESAKSAVLLARQGALESMLADLVRTADAPTVGGFPELILARVTSRVLGELEWLRAVAAEVERTGWAAMRPTFQGVTS